ILTMDSAIDLNTGGCTPAIPSMTGWIRLYLDTVDFSRINTGSNIPTVNATALKRRLLPLPPLAEQHRIVARIERAFSALDTIDALQAKYADNLAVLKSKLIDAAIQGKLTKQLPEDGTAEELYRQIQAEKQALIKAGKIKKEKPLPEITADEIPFDIPKSWKWVRLAVLCKSVMDGDHQPPPQVEDGIPFLVISNISKGVFDLSDVRHVPRDYYDSLSNERIAEKGDILFTVTGSFGIPVIVSIDGEFCFQRHMALLKPIVASAYLHLALRSTYVQKYCDEVAIGTAQRTVGIKQLRRIPIPLPPIAEQKRIVAKLEEVLPLCEQLIITKGKD
ncbi:MAG: restriction endonuclease subunit S, partial [Victivallales bacterium]|nr:restriction endonuclease subunit S [Victivallales bacterium]